MINKVDLKLVMFYSFHALCFTPYFSLLGCLVWKMCQELYMCFVYMFKTCLSLHWSLAKSKDNDNCLYFSPLQVVFVKAREITPTDHSLCKQNRQAWPCTSINDISYWPHRWLVDYGIYQTWWVFQNYHFNKSAICMP